MYFEVSRTHHLCSSCCFLVQQEGGDHDCMKGLAIRAFALTRARAEHPRAPVWREYGSSFPAQPYQSKRWVFSPIPPKLLSHFGHWTYAHIQ